ncbi:Werner syndrome-like exonuclease [Thalictrum thalictroides]|uniref:Werner syndrome-like exonuclease n=1 Tax=Thalictrum thalictroides TaxID=46969 RepID=A0A7J6URI3_THATH|nr:Werner syndrome-like exonuclease [Thalictrum thalictroides]
MTISIQDSRNYYPNTQSCYTVNIFGNQINTIVTHTPSVVNHFISNVLNKYRRSTNVIVGLDIEWRPSFSRNQNPPAIIQLCIDNKCLIFQFLYCRGIPQSLADFLNNPDFDFVGVGIDGDVEKLERFYDLNVCNAIDVRPFAVERYGDSGLRNTGMRTLAHVVLDMEIYKPREITLSRWDDAYLSYEQVQYACVDAYLSYHLGLELLD